MTGGRGAPQNAGEPVSLTAAGVKRGLIRLAPVSLFVIPFGVAFGAAASGAGLSLAQVIAMSALVFAGASQFAAIDLWPPAPPFVSLALLMLVVNARHVIFGAALAPWLNRARPGQRIAVLAVLSDANYVDGRNALRGGERDLGVVLGGGLALWATWVLGSALGAAAGAALGPLETYGVDIVMAAFFTALMVSDLDRRLRAAEAALRVLGPAVVGAAVAAATLPVLPLGWNIIAAALAGGAVVLVMDGGGASGRAAGQEGAAAGPERPGAGPDP